MPSIAVSCADFQGDEEVRNARQKVLEAVKTEDTRKMRRYLNRYAADMLLVRDDVTELLSHTSCAIFDFAGLHATWS